MAEFEISKSKPLPRTEQETIINYDYENDAWYLYTNVAKHCRKYEDRIIPSDNLNNRKVYHEETGQLIELEGKIDGSVTVNKRREMSDEQKEELRKRMKKMLAERTKG